MKNKFCFVLLMLLVLIGLTFCVKEEPPIVKEEPPNPINYVPTDKATDPVPFKSEFTATFKKNLMDSQHLLDYAPGAWDVFWWTDTDMGAPFCVLEQKGTGTDAKMGNFTIQLSSFWTSSDNSGFTTGNIIDHYGESLYLDILPFEFPFSPEFPYDRNIYSYWFDVAGGTGKFDGSRGSGNFTFGVSDTSTNVMVHKWEGTIKLAKGK